jgi:acyl-CoA synthetase (AMP-forming)/AMP-acid ligase II
VTGRPDTLPAAIAAGAAAHDGCPLIFVTGDGERETTLGALVSDAERVAAALQARGIEPGDVVAVQLPGSYEGAVTQAAVTLCGAVLLPVVMIYGSRELGFLLRQAGARALVLPREYRGRPHAAAVLGGLPALPGDSLDKRAGTDGALIAGNQVRVVDPDGADVPGARDGEILTRGPELFTGYTDPALNAAAFLPGRWFRTGDIGRLDADGYLTITDRLKDIIIRGGENIASKEVEDLLVTHPAVADVAVIAAPDPVLGERVCAVVVPRPGCSFDVAEARAHFAAAGAARQKTPEVVVLADELPRTPAGKVRKEVLRARLKGSPGGAGLGPLRSG